MDDINQHNMDIQALKSDILSLHTKLDYNSERYMEKLSSIEVQTIKTNGRINAHDDKLDQHSKIIWTALGGGSMLLLLPTLQAIISKLSQ